MSIRTILAPVRGDGKGESVLDHARVVANRFDAHIDVIHARARDQDLMPYGVLMTASMHGPIPLELYTSLRGHRFLPLGSGILGLSCAR